MSNIEEFLNKRTLIIGDVNSGKTRCTLDIIKLFVEKGINDIAVLDLAPRIFRGVGGKIDLSSYPGILYLTADVLPPRLMGRDESETTELALRNALLIEELFARYRECPREVLFINDVTLYLHKGTLETLLSVLDDSRTQVLNAYHGTVLGSSSLGARERRLVDELMESCDRVIKL